MASAHHMDVMSMVSDVVPIDTSHPNTVLIVPDVVPIERGYPMLFPHTHAFCLCIIPEVPGSSAHCPFGPQRLGMTLETTYVICMSSLWSPETWDYIRDHTGYYLCGPHVCMWSAHHLVHHLHVILMVPRDRA